MYCDVFAVDCESFCEYICAIAANAHNGMWAANGYRKR